MRRGVAQHDLHQQRQKHGAAVEHESDPRHQERAYGVRTVFEDGKIDDGMIGFQLANDQPAESNQGHHGKCEDEVRAEPVFFLALVQHDLQRAHAHDQQADAPEVNTQRFPAQIRRIEDEQLREDDRNNSDRNVDVKDPAPTVVVGDPAAGNGTEHGSNHDTQRPESHGLTAFVGRKRLQQDGLRERLQTAAAGALNEPKNDKEAERWRESAEERGAREADDRRHQQALASEVVSQPAGHGENDGVGDQIRGKGPGRFVSGGREAACNMRQRNVDHGRVQHLHEGARHDGNRNQPGIDVVGRFRLRRHSLSFSSYLRDM